MPHLTSREGAKPAKKILISAGSTSRREAAGSASHGCRVAPGITPSTRRTPSESNPSSRALRLRVRYFRVQTASAGNDLSRRREAREGDIPSLRSWRLGVKFPGSKSPSPPIIYRSGAEPAEKESFCLRALRLREIPVRCVVNDAPHLESRQARGERQVDQFHLRGLCVFA